MCFFSLLWNQAWTEETKAGPQICHMVWKPLIVKPWKALILESFNCDIESNKCGLLPRASSVHLLMLLWNWMQYMCASSVCFGGDKRRTTNPPPGVETFNCDTAAGAKLWSALPLMGHLYKAPRSGWRNFQPPPKSSFTVKPKLMFWYTLDSQVLRICTFVFK